MKSDNKRHLDLGTFCKRRLSKVYLFVVLVTIFWIPVALYFGQYKNKREGDLI